MPDLKEDWEKEKERILKEYRENKARADARERRVEVEDNNKDEEEKPKKKKPGKGSQWRRGASSALERADEIEKSK